DGASGLQDLSRIVTGAAQHLRPGGALWLELGWDQAQAVRGLLADAGFENVHSRHDLAGIERISGGRRPAARG
ncbi:MAG TPA: protein-(glutamine-N5) methyltransferase, release factor-specific, partial [Achromobacter sp.]|nr:protein-(glutamine-N5) methyltransferase, release factor-specific [Achromobacter sp.]